LRIDAAHDQDDLAAALEVMAVCFGTTPAQLSIYHWVHASKAGQVLVARTRREVVGTASVVCFGDTGWLGGVSVAPKARRRGVGTRLTEAAVGLLSRRGASTHLLLATAEGTPVYERLGFEPEGEYGLWAGRVPQVLGAPPRGVRGVRGDDLDAVRELDRSVTGEDRSVAIAAAWPDGFVAVDAAGRLRGYHLRAPWAGGPTIALDAPAGAALIDAARRRSAIEARIALPAANRAGREAMARFRFRELRRVQRMRRGPAVAWRPEGVFGVFDLFWA
jgi:predicted N-acetyltransferase YhbS